MTDPETADRRVVFDFEITFLNGGGVQGQDFRLDVPQAGINDAELAQAIVRDLRLLMVKDVRILNKRFIFERHKRASAPAEQEMAERDTRFIDLSHTIVDGMMTYPGLPAPHVCDYLSREASEQHYGDGTTFQIGRIDMVANTGTYLDTPFHRFEDGCDLSQIELPRLAQLDAVVVRVAGSGSRAIDRLVFGPIDVRGKAVLVHTGWAQHWGTPQYFDGHPFLTEAAAVYLKEQGAVLVGIDSLNIDSTSDGTRPVHSTLLRAGIPIVEHLGHLERLPAEGFKFSAVPPKVKGMGTFPVRAFASL